MGGPEQKTCGTCEWHDDFLWLCRNTHSPKFEDYAWSNDTCPKWLKRGNEPGPGEKQMRDELLNDLVWDDDRGV